MTGRAWIRGRWVAAGAAGWCAVVMTGAYAAIPSAPSVYDLPAEPSGTRSVVGGTLATSVPGWSEASISWSVTPNLDGSLRYTYVLTGFLTPAVLHFTLDLTNTAVTDPLSVTSATLNGDPAPFGLGDFDGVTGAVQFAVGGSGTLVYSFDSNRAPVWGHFLISGMSGSAGNVAFGDETSPDPLDYIARPNGSIPEPAGLALLGAAGLTLLRRR